MTILLAVDHWRSYLLHAEFIIKTDKKSLVHLDDQRLSTPWQHKALTKLLGLNYKITYKQGKENRVADALSRATHSKIHELQAISTLIPPGSKIFKLHMALIQNPPSYCMNWRFNHHLDTITSRMV